MDKKVLTKLKYINLMVIISFTFLNGGISANGHVVKTNLESNRVVAFEALLNILDNSSLSPDDKKSSIITFFSEQESYGFPIMNASTVYIVYRSNESAITLISDLTLAGIQDMTQVPDTDLFYRKFELHRDTLGSYRFLSETGEFTDPLNPLQHIDGRAEENFTLNNVLLNPGDFFNSSLLQMPDYEDDGSYLFNLDIGSEIIHFNFSSSIQTLYNRSIYVYLPPGYHDNTLVAYPTLYAVDGSAYLHILKAGASLDWLIFHNKIEPIIAVFIDTLNINASDALEWRNKDLSYTLCDSSLYPQVCRDNFAKVVATELVDYIDNQYRTLDSAAARAIVGGSLGGYMSLIVSNFYPEVFALTGWQSGVVWPSATDTYLKIRNDPKIETRRYYVGVGTRYDTFEDSETLIKELHKNNYTTKFRVFHKAHSWANFRSNFAEMVEFLFTDASSDYSGLPVGYTFPAETTTTTTTPASASWASILSILYLMALVVFRKRKKA
ncbi:MAG: alpha/beta hydrolase-fold protein [Candidatus Hodarchaeales archaeon]|jgi:enterochelin esterase-like enzyme